MTVKTQTPLKPNTIKKARQGIARILDRYRLTMPEVLGTAPSRVREQDELVWGSLRKDYEKIQKALFAKTYPALWRMMKKRG